MGILTLLKSDGLPDVDCDVVDCIVTLATTKVAIDDEVNASKFGPVGRDGRQSAKLLDIEVTIGHDCAGLRYHT